MENLGIDIKLLIAQLINFGIFFFIVKKFITKPFLEFVDSEKKKENEKEKIMAEVQKQEENYQKKEKELSLRVKKEIEKAMIEAKKHAAELKSDLLIEARQEVETLKQSTKTELEKEREALYSEVKDKVSKLSLLIVNKGLNEVLDEQSKRKISEKLINKLSKNINLYEN